MKLNAVYIIAVLFFTSAAAGTAEPDLDEASLRETINYGTDNEIADLIKILRADGLDYLDEDLVRLAEKTRNQNIILGIFSFFNDRKKNGLEETALAILNERENETPQKINAALDYLGTVKERRAVPVMMEIISRDDARFHNAAIRAIGKINYSETDEPGAAEGEDAGITGIPDITETLIDYYSNRNPGGDTREAIIWAVGSSGGKNALPFLMEIINGEDQSIPIRMTALEAAGRLKDEGALDLIIASAASDDPNIRFAAVGALGNFNGDNVDAVILESFRDTYFKTRLAAVRSAKTRGFKDAIPYLRYRAEKDEAAAVREEAVLALGSMKDDTADSMLVEMLDNEKLSDGLRSLCAEMLIKNNADGYAEKVIAKLDEAKAKKMTNLYKGLLKAIGLAKTDKVENLTARLFASKDVSEKFYALDMTANNRFTALRDEVEKLTKEKNISISGRAKKTLEKLE
ncbi:MAG: HEAT repeat domain-containing protein [Spirochaetaceae bacterium]|jgi:HEAT repeat protein|nr:HEAT repeat domain-containing protein [Spirochaetaceae bacterium]